MPKVTPMIRADVHLVCGVCGNTVDRVIINLDRLPSVADQLAGAPPECEQCWQRPGSDTHAHTALDQSSLRLAGVDPSTVQPRERAVPCAVCGTATWHLAACCDQHYAPPGVCQRRSL